MAFRISVFDIPLLISTPPKPRSPHAGTSCPLPTIQSEEDISLRCVWLHLQQSCHWKLFLHPLRSHDSVVHIRSFQDVDGSEIKKK